MGSELAYEHLASQEIEKCSYGYKGEETLAGDACLVVKRIPVDKKSAYSRQVSWFDQNEYRLRRVDSCDHKGDLLKNLALFGYQQYLPLYWRPNEMLLTNHQTGKSTVLQFNNYRLQAGLMDKDSSQSALARIR